jgi:hypothetical protein
MFKGRLEFAVRLNGVESNKVFDKVVVADKMMIRIGSDKNAELHFGAGAAVDRMAAVIEFDPWTKESRIELMHLGGACPIHVHDMQARRTQRFMQTRTKLAVGDWFEIGDGNCVQFTRFVSETTGFDVETTIERYFERPVTAEPIVSPPKKMVSPAEWAHFDASSSRSPAQRSVAAPPSPLPSPEEADVRAAFDRIAMQAAETVAGDVKASQKLVGDSMLIASVIGKYFALKEKK